MWNAGKRHAQGSCRICQGATEEEGRGGGGGDKGEAASPICRAQGKDRRKSPNTAI